MMLLKTIAFSTKVIAVSATILAVFMSVLAWADYDIAKEKKNKNKL